MKTKERERIWKVKEKRRINYRKVMANIRNNGGQKTME